VHRHRDRAGCNFVHRIFSSNLICSINSSTRRVQRCLAARRAPVMNTHRPSSSTLYHQLPPSDQDPDGDPLLSSQSTGYVAHFATESEKKRIWWRNAFVNGMFIGAWCVSPWSRSHSYLRLALPGSSSRFCSPCTTNGCSLQNTSDFPFRCSSRPSTLSCSSFFRSFYGRSPHDISGQIGTQPGRTGGAY
jgi:hypothetical protein